MGTSKLNNKKDVRSEGARIDRYGDEERFKFLGIRAYVLRPMLYTLKQALKSTFGKQPEIFFENKRGTNTILYPDVKLKVPDNYRGKNEVAWELCIGCELCARVCPNKCITMESIPDEKLSDLDENVKGPFRSNQDEKKALIKRPGINFGRCMFCGNCEEYCPTGAMRMTGFYELADTSRDSLVFSAESLRIEVEPVEDLHNLIQEEPYLNVENCTGCQLCFRHCPTRAIEMIEGPKMRKEKPIKNPKVDMEVCVGCSTCVATCKFDALKMIAKEAK